MTFETYYLDFDISHFNNQTLSTSNRLVVTHKGHNAFAPTVSGDVTQNVYVSRYLLQQKSLNRKSMICELK